MTWVMGFWVKYKFIVSLNPSVKPSVCHLPFQGRLSSLEGSHERGAVTQWLRGLPSPQREGFKNIANGFTKNAMKLHFDKSFGQAFLKACQGLGWNPKVLFTFLKAVSVYAAVLYQPPCEGKAPDNSNTVCTFLNRHGRVCSLWLLSLLDSFRHIYHSPHNGL